IAEAVVQPVVAVLPELPRVRREPEAAPPLRPRRLALQRELCDAPLEPLARLDRTALWRRGGGETRTERPRGEVRVRLGIGDPGDGALDAHLAAERLPVEEERRARVLRQLLPFAARVVREEDDPVLLR